jgi:hypothetical protein
MMRGFVSATYAPICEAKEGRWVSPTDVSVMGRTSTQEKAIMTIARMHVEAANHVAKIRMIRT